MINVTGARLWQYGYVIHRLNELFGYVGDELGRQNFAKGTITRVNQNPIVLKGDLSQAVMQALL